MRSLLWAMLCIAGMTSPVRSQAPARPADAPLPDAEWLTRQVILKQQHSEITLQDYLVWEQSSVVHGVGHCDPYPTAERQEHADPCLTRSWFAMSEEDRRSEVFWLVGVHIHRLLSTGGFDHRTHGFGHTLSAEELHRENERIDAELTKEGQRKEERLIEIRLSRLLELGTLSNPRRISERGQSVIVMDYAGGTCLAACAPVDAAAAYLRGTLSIAEDDLVVSSFKVRFTDTWVERGGAGETIPAESTLEYRSDRMQGGNGFPDSIVTFITHRHGRSSDTVSEMLQFRDYRKFRVTSTILPDFALLPTDSTPEPADERSRPW